uniref:EF-hand domain-containing protein n=1 Tax=Chenopodium quinoa TaxID=63459 RepID=A0A803KWI7_CHEQI
MGHGNSKDSSSSSHSRRAKLRQKLRRVVRRDSRLKQSGNGFKLVSADDFAGIALLTLISLIDAFGNQAAADKKDELFKDADKNGDGVVSIDELASLLSYHQEKESLINSCPVCGELLDASNQVGSMVHMTLCFNEGTGNNAMSGGFLTDKQASYGWLLKLSEWAQYSSYGIGLNSGSKAGHILVWKEEGGKEIMQKLSEKQGEKMNSAGSTKEIPKFIELFKDQLNLSETKYPLDHFKTFNEFFIRELKPGARPIAFMDRDDIAVCGADSRLTAFKNVEDSTRFWIKGRKFSIQGLLGNDVSASHFIGGTLVIFRLAPQVNPIAVNSLCDVFTENKRAVSIISTSCFGKVAFVAIGATMVGSITFTRKQGDYVQKGEEFGYFSFGGSTVICVFEKGAIKLDEDLLDNSARSLETLVRVGMTLGVSTKTNIR